MVRHNALKRHLARDHVPDWQEEAMQHLRAVGVEVEARVVRSWKGFVRCRADEWNVDPHLLAPDLFKAHRRTWGLRRFCRVLLRTLVEGAGLAL